eukprot:scaffold91775_cov80-Phaeocystis_antarctica.AAC.1
MAGAAAPGCQQAQHERPWHGPAVWPLGPLRPERRGRSFGVRGAAQTLKRASQAAGVASRGTTKTAR